MTDPPSAKAWGSCLGGIAVAILGTVLALALGFYVALKL
jgi:hypothetical protein